MNETKISWATHTLNCVHGCSKPAAVPEAGVKIFQEFDQRFAASLTPESAAEEFGTVRTFQIPRKWCKHGSSPECIRCYAEELSNRRGKYAVSQGREPKGWTVLPWSEENEAENVHLHPERFHQIKSLELKSVKLRPSQRQRIFICSMGDIFHRLVPIAFLRELFAYMGKYPHIYMLLTKRPDRAEEIAAAGIEWPEWVWLGTTSGSPSTKWRWEYLRRSQAKVRFISMEPMTASMTDDAANAVLGKLNLEGIHQVIVGGESGAGYRPMHQKWCREVRDLCVKSGVAYFHKQDAAARTETRPYLVEEDGRCMEYHQYPGELTPPALIQRLKPEALTVLQ